jgi:hypothetical protein
MIECNVCFRHCRLEEGQTGACGARKNENGESICINYGELTSLSIDPIEKKPFARFHPGSRILSVGSYGCNLFCPFCQNYEISTARRGEVRTRKVKPETIANLAKDSEASGNIGVAFTYNEPMVGWEFVRDTEARSGEGTGQCGRHQRLRCAGDSAGGAPVYRRLQHRSQGLYGGILQKARRRPRNGQDFY